MPNRRGATRLMLASACAVFALPAFAQSNLQITEIWMGNEPGDNLSADWFEIVNTGTDAWVAGVDGDLFYDDESQDPAAADPITGIIAIEPGEAVVVLVSDTAADAQEFTALWSQVYVLDGVQIGATDGSGLGQGGDGVTLFVGPPAPETIADFQAYPDANANGGQSWDVGKQGFSEVGDLPFEAVATRITNDVGQPAIGSPGNLGPAPMIGDAPVITLSGDAMITLMLDDVFVDPGAVAIDAEDGDISSDIVVGGDVVDTSMFGNYVITYDVSDSDGNAAATAMRTVIVTYPETIPADPQPLQPDLFVQVSTLGDLPGAEISAYDAASAQAYITSGDGLQFVDLSDPSNPVAGALLDPAVEPFDLGISEITSVAACDGVVAFAVPNDPQTDPGWVVFIEADGTPIRTVTVGALPDMVTFTSDCSRLLAANEGEPDGGVDPEGSISVVDVATGEVSTADFTAFNGLEDALRAAGVRLFPDTPTATDVEPEYIAVAPGDSRAYVTLQEANAIALVDIESATVVDIFAMGLKNHSLVGNALDASDQDGVINIRNWPLMGMYMPDAIAAYRSRAGRVYYITANEGDARNEDERVGSLTLDPVAFPPEQDVQNVFNIGRIQVSSIDGDVDGDGDYDVLQAYGGRSFSIWNAVGNQVYDSGNDIEAIVAAQTPDNYDDGRSDNKGPEPEGVEIGQLFGGRTLAFIGLERTDQVMVYDVSRPFVPRFLQILQTEGDEAPEGLRFIGPQDSPNRCSTLLVTNEGSNTLTVYQRRLCGERETR